MSELKRYEPAQRGFNRAPMDEDVDGDYVKYSDIEPLIEALKFYGDIDSWRACECEESNLHYNQIQKDDLGTGDFEKPTGPGHWLETVDDNNVGGLKARDVLKKFGVVV